MIKKIKLDKGILVKLIKKILKLILPQKIITYLRGKINHEGYLLLIFPPLKFILRYLSNNVLKKLHALGILSYDYVYNYSIPRKIRKKIMNSYDKDKFYLNIGGSLGENKKNWRLLEYCGDPILNIGYRYHPELVDYNIDLMEKKKWNINDNSVDLIYTSHCLEHLTQSAAEFVFRETLRILKTNGVFRISVPDSNLAYRALEDGDYLFFQKFNAKEKLLDKSKGDNVSSTIESQFLKFFCTYKLDSEKLTDFQKDFKEMKREDLLNKYRNLQEITANYHSHLNWFNFEKIKDIAIIAGYKDDLIYLSKKNSSISEEMRTDNFDKTAPNYSVYVDIVKH